MKITLSQKYKCLNYGVQSSTVTGIHRNFLNFRDLLKFHAGNYAVCMNMKQHCDDDQEAFL